MKDKTLQRIQNSNSVSKDELIEGIKNNDPIRYDQMLIESEERKVYYFVNYKSQAYSRSPLRLDFPLFKDLVDDFEQNIDQSGSIKVLENNSFIDKVKTRTHKSPTSNSKYASENLIFSDLKLKVENSKVNLNQPIYYIPSDTSRCTCGTCDGDMYTTCIQSECHGQHIYDCNKCNAQGSIKCSKCEGKGEKSCPTCKGKGRINCKGYVGPGSGGPASNMVYPCNGDKTTCSKCYGKNCSACGFTGYAACPICGGEGTNPCSKKYNSSYGVGKLFDTVSGVEFCEGTQVIKCSTCDASGQVECDKCDGNCTIECNTCYGDYEDNRYGKVDCVTCETAGELATISYIETEILEKNFEVLVTDGRNIDAPNFNVNSIKKFTNSNSSQIETYKFLNDDKSENYDEYSTFCSKKVLENIGFSKNRYPKLISEEMYYEGVPCSTFNYNHFLTATFHDVSVLAIDKEKEVFYHSDPTAVAEEKETIKQKINELLKKAFSTKSYKDKVDRKHEMFLMLHMAKADGIIQEEEKRYLAKTITGMEGFTNKEKAELFSLMSMPLLPIISPLNAYFSSKIRADEAKNKIVELVAKADGIYLPLEQQKIDEINKAIELGFKAKPKAITQFFKTWQVSISIFILITTLILSNYWFFIIRPVQVAASEHQELLVEMKNIETYLAQPDTVFMDANFMDPFEVKDKILELKHESNLMLGDEKKAITYISFWKNKQKDLLAKVTIFIDKYKLKKAQETVSEDVVEEELPEFTPDDSGAEVYPLVDKVYFYSKPIESSKLKSFFLSGQSGLLLGYAGDFTKVEFEYNGKITIGYVLSNEVEIGGLGGEYEEEPSEETEYEEPVLEY